MTVLAIAGCANQPRSVRAFDVGPRPRAAASAAIDARYTPEALKEAFLAVCQRLHYQPLRVQVDQSEFPYVVYGVLAGRCDYGAIRDALRDIPGYAYAGCFTGSRNDGARTIIALNLVPDAVSQVDRQQLMARLRTLGLSQQ